MMHGIGYSPVFEASHDLPVTYANAPSQSFKSIVFRPAAPFCRCPLGAKSGSWRSYSIISSARPNNDSGTLMPSDLAVLRFRNISTFAPRWTGRSAGFSRLRIRQV